MLIIKSILLLHQKMRYFRQKNRKIALVPTMGNLHNGHIKLINEAKAKSDIVIVSIFINPMQFESVEDLTCYPRTPQEDFQKLNDCHIDCIFFPSVEEIYPQGVEKSTYIEIPGISTIFGSTSRHFLHFRGVCTIVGKLFNLIQPNLAFFGEKDFQQLVLIRKMVSDLGYNIKIIGIPIVREKDGLAYSSRNNHLTDDQRKKGPCLYKIISKMAGQLREKEWSVEKIVNLAAQELSNCGFHLDDLQIRDADTLQEVTEASHRAVILVSAWLGKIRLIDNEIIKLA